jgi:polyhydroxyalkanoate synthase
MTDTHPPDAAEFAANMATVAAQCQRIAQAFMARQWQDFADKPFDPMHMSEALGQFYARMAEDPAHWWSRQMELWQGYVALWQNSAARAMGEETAPLIQPDAKDRRFKDEAWQQSVVFDFMKQAYLLTARWLQQSVRGVPGMDAHTLQKLDFATRQFVDALSPSNFLLTNPEVLKATLDTQGENLVKGLSQLLADLEKSNDALRISMTDMAAFEVGKNLATTPGKVVYENDLMQLIQYEPATKEVYKTPLLIIPAWINKYYILDLQPDNSLVKYLVESGYTVFVISWVNPDERHAHKTFDDYMSEGPLAALDAIAEATGEEQVSIGAYCLGGTLTSITLAWLKAKGQAHRVNSVTYLTTMVDFADAGELSVFIDEGQLRDMEAKMAQRGYLDGSEMALTFNMLRANDLIWSFVVNNYLLGREPFPFDLLYWNADSTRMPAAMHSFYLRSMYQKNLLVRPGGITIAGVPIDLSTIDTPTYMLSTREDHIAPWKSTYAATHIYRGPIRFVLAASGHIAGVVNPPGRKKYSHWVSESEAGAFPKSPESWLAKSREEAGSWWPDWLAWHAAYRGSKVPARQPGGGKLAPIEPAPGRYARVKS